MQGHALQPLLGSLFMPHNVSCDATDSGLTSKQPHGQGLGHRFVHLPSYHGLPSHAPSC